MSTIDSETTSISRFWDCYIEQLNKRAIKRSCQRWYVNHVEQLIAAHPAIGSDSIAPQVLSNGNEQCPY